ncbi:hypothetical protein DXT99_21845 [Pontibacter diazotrophicus]|uniref:Cytochrome C oxidase subunit I n=1 Tax=Pontibacter diazotrophicus TaxID=1400979 RepID=A0A3D8L6S5_9BACT|nr:hypothetical protein [Pontibacter diazotrophicus]RDV13023.1 hypothetical protein DXT99_21845 [Pontibacter diazotrophicus]
MLLQEERIKGSPHFAVAATRGRVALAYFALVAAMGLLLRWLLVAPVVGINYKYVLHGHSHVALLGWLYCAFFAVLLYMFPAQTDKGRKSFKWQFFLTQVSVVGMMLGFPVQGYALLSIIFSTMHILLSYWFAYTFWKQAKRDGALQQKYSTALQYLGASLLFLVFSSIGPWAMGPILATGNSGGTLYYSAIYFYLHFQYNGWFTFAVLGMLFWFLEHHHIAYSKKLAINAFWLLAVACVPAVALSVLWAKPATVVYWIGGAAGLMQLMALYLLLKLLWEVRQQVIAVLKPWVQLLMGLAMFFFVVKLALQAASALPAMANLAYRVRYFIIGYLHLSLIGFVSLFLFGAMLQLGLYRLGKYGKSGLILLLLGFFSTELLMFLHGTLLWLGLPFIPSFNLLMFFFSIPMPIGLGLLFMSQLKTEKEPAAGEGKPLKKQQAMHLIPVA